MSMLASALQIDLGFHELKGFFLSEVKIFLVDSIHV
jgi:hypothetical protein